MAINYEIPDERRFENDVDDILNFVHSSSLQDINVQVIINKMKDILKDNRLLYAGLFLSSVQRNQPDRRSGKEY